MVKYLPTYKKAWPSVRSTTWFQRKKIMLNSAYPVVRGPCKEYECRQANWSDTAGLLESFRQSQSLKAPLETPSVWDQRKYTILDPCLPGWPVKDCGPRGWRIRVGSSDLWGTPGISPGAYSVSCIYKRPSGWVVVASTLICWWHSAYLTVGGSDDGTVPQNDLNRLSMWESQWDMEFNPPKCQVVRVTTARKAINTVYRLHGQVLDVVTSAKYLGVDISGGLSWNSHIDRITGNANRTLGYIKRNIKTKNPKVRETAYNTLVRPQLEYAAPIWDPYTKEKTHQLEKIQRRAARWTTSNYDYRSSVTAMLDQLGWRTLEQRRADARLCLFYKIVYGLVAVPLPDYKSYNPHTERPGTATQWLFARSKQLGIIISIHSFHWQ